MTDLSLILRVPAAAVYNVAVTLRNFLYDKHLLCSSAVAVPTVCVGNLAVGGTGKTPVIEWLVRTLSPSYKLAVLSRGYKRRTTGFVLADGSSTALTIGDECMQLHTNFPDLPVAVCNDRVRGIRLLLKACPDVQVVLLDDAFQHRRLRCGFNILLTAADRLYVTDHMLPWGTLRDTKWQSHRADAVIVTKCLEDMLPIDKRLIDKSLHLAPWQSLFFSTMRYAPLPDFVQALPSDADVLLVAGIARPEYLVTRLKQRFPQLRVLAFPDHHRFSRADIRKMEKQAEQAAAVLTTEKDRARMLPGMFSDNFIGKLAVVSVSVDIDNAQLLEQQLHKYISSCQS